MEPRRVEVTKKQPIGSISYDPLNVEKLKLPDVTDQLKYDTGKTMWHLLPLDVIEGIAKVMTFGADKYSEDGWKNTDLGISRCYSAMMRHYMAMQSGEHIDPESGLPHAYHFATNAMFIAYKNVEGEADGDR